jgi:putative phage-type endonuclease
MTTPPALRRDTAEWLEARRKFITSTDLPIILGLSPYRVEADLAAEKMGAEVDPPDAKRQEAMDLGKRLEDVIRETDQDRHGIRTRKVNRFLVHPQIEWAATSLDFERVGERTIVETKASRSRRWDDGLPQDVEAQVRWQMGVGNYPRAHVAVLRSGSELECFDVEHDPATFDGLVDIAADFRARLAAGGPFTESSDSIKRRYPNDSGAEIRADVELEEAVATLIASRQNRKALEAQEEALENAIKMRMADASTLIGPSWRVTWKRTKDSETVDWKSIADGLLRQLQEPERTALVGIHTTVRPGVRPFRVVSKENE